MHFNRIYGGENLFSLVEFEKLFDVLRKEEEKRLKVGDVLSFESVNVKITHIDKEGITFSNNIN